MVTLYAPGFFLFKVKTVINLYSLSYFRFHALYFYCKLTQFCNNNNNHNNNNNNRSLFVRPGLYIKIHVFSSSSLSSSLSAAGYHVQSSQFFSHKNPLGK